MKFIKSIVPYIIILITVILIRTFIVTPVSVDGSSMYPNLKDGNILLLKRIIGLPGEHVEYRDSKLYINGQEVEEPMINAYTSNFKLESIGYDKIPDDYYFVVGDNRGISKDSRIIGLIKKKDIIGTTSFSLWPFKKLK